VTITLRTAGDRNMLPSNRSTAVDEKRLAKRICAHPCRRHC
jgi:hypothetical protein